MSIFKTAVRLLYIVLGKAIHPPQQRFLYYRKAEKTLLFDALLFKIVPAKGKSK
jgi:hypothetical protein